MIDQKRIAEAEKRVNQYLKEEWLILKHKDSANNVRFFLKNAETSLLTAQVLFDISNDSVKKQAVRQTNEFESYLWVVVASYYSMFYASLALLAKNEMKTSGREHEVVENTLIARFIGNNRLARLLEGYQETKDKALQITGAQEKAEELVVSYIHERQKRNELQYEIGKSAKHNLAQTSLENASEFVAEIRNIA